MKRRSSAGRGDRKWRARLKRTPWLCLDPSWCGLRDLAAAMIFGPGPAPVPIKIGGEHGHR